VKEMKEAMFYKVIEKNVVQCNLCSHRCKIPQSKRGICGVRENQGGQLFSLNYGKIVSRAVDPIEKKPLFHFFPATNSYSIAAVGCNFRCENCQNFEISQLPRDRNLIIGQEISPEEIVQAAKRTSCESIAYTYVEPTIFYEFALETAILAHREGIKNIFVTNGYMSSEALEEFSPYLDAANIDLKSFNEEFYKRNCGAALNPVLDSIKMYKDLGIWIEITTLVIPTLNDTKEELLRIASFVRDVGEEIPWHISRFHPMYKLATLPITPLSTLHMAKQIGLNVGLRYVYEGNVPGEEGENTFCYNCGRLLIKRYRYQIIENHIKDSKCFNCETRIDGLFKE
jgi:pyruvate formate lyase activating enzyme